MSIKSFHCKDTQRLFNRSSVRRFAVIESVARRKLQKLRAAASLDFLRVPTGNRLELLKGARAGQYSIRINDQFRICFRCSGQDAEDVEIADCR